jgi:hypothetical protein
MLDSAPAFIDEGEQIGKGCLLISVTVCQKDDG